MKYLQIYNKVLGCKNQDEVFKHLIKNLKESILLWNYFVNWEKVFESVRNVEIHLNILNSLIGKKDFDYEFKSLISKYPEVITTIPVLLVRDGNNSKKFKILVDYSNKKFVYEDFNFENQDKLSSSEIEKILTFVHKTGLSRLFIENKVKNLIDYVIGVEAGLDSNGRKNRGGQAMESIVDFFISSLCKKYKFKYLKEANSEVIEKEFGCKVPVDKSSRRYDFVIYNGRKIFIIEVNFYAGGGSKLKATAGEYRALYDLLQKAKHPFIWITDGVGWKTAENPLRETFNHNDYLLSLDMVEKGILENIILIQ
jgi:type II restriction enzyme